MKLNIHILLITVCVAVLMLSSSQCVERKHYRPEWKYCGPMRVSKEQYEKDKDEFCEAYLRRTEGWEVFPSEGFPDKKGRDRYDVLVDTILYSRDGRFMYIFQGLFDRCMKMSKSSINYYSCEAYIGFRDSIGGKCRYYRHTQNYNCLGDEFRELMDEVEFIFLEYMRIWPIFPTGLDYGPIGYDLNDPDFFEKTRLFQKYNDSLYYFQIDAIMGYRDSVDIKLKTPF